MSYKRLLPWIKIFLYIQDGEDHNESETGGPEAPVDVSSLLEPLNSGPCIFRTKDWWTYEVRSFF
jgi:hypothetical protein